MEVDLPLDKLAAYRYAEPEPADFDEFWRRTLDEAGGVPVAAEFAPYDALLRTVDTFDVTFAGYGGDPIKGWLILPADRSGPLPTIVEYIGYGGGRGIPLDWLPYASAGYAHFVMDTRGQGSTWRTGDTADPAPSGPQAPGFVTRGILDPHDYYYRRLYVDAYRAVDAARAHPDVDPTRIAVTGRSQGGALSVAVGGLRHDIAAAIPHVPFLSAFRRATAITDADPYQEIVRWCSTHRTKADQAFATLAYFDGTSFAARATCRGSFSVGLMDPICPPSTVYAAHNVWAGPKDITVWPFNNHDGGGPEDQIRTIKVLRDLFG
ncbi:MAG TPA: acetylxylan esterase [Asanoa sp.]|nr:acetylxylan esterase [Asanoa sp.]